MRFLAAIAPLVLVLAPAFAFAGGSARLLINEVGNHPVSGCDQIELRAFLGYSGWTQGQLEGELRQNAWVIAPVEGVIGGEEQGIGMWRSIIRRVSPELHLLAEAPDDPQLN